MRKEFGVSSEILFDNTQNYKFEFNSWFGYMKAKYEGSILDGNTKIKIKIDIREFINGLISRGLLSETLQEDLSSFLERHIEAKG